MYNGLLFVVHSEIKFLVFIQSDSPSILTPSIMQISVIKNPIFRVFKYMYRYLKTMFSNTLDF